MTTRKAFVAGGVLPMLAHRFDEHGDKLTYPAYAQPKLDGYRGIYADGAFTSRTGLPIAEATRIRAELAGTGLVLDGELFRPGLSFQEVTKLIKRNDPSLEYHVYDVIMPAPYEERKAALEARIKLGNRPSEPARMKPMFIDGAWYSVGAAKP